MEVEELHVLEFLAGSREELFGAFDVIVHRPAHVQQHQQLDLVPALGLEVQIEIAGIVGGGADRVL